MKELIISDLNNFIGTGNIEFNKKILQIVPSGYGENDILIGISSPNLRKIAKKYYKNIDVDTITYFLHSNIHEYRLFALMIMVLCYKYDNKLMFNLYINNISFINNWDLVDISCSNIVGNYLYNNFSDAESLVFVNKLYGSSNIWERRISIVSMHYFIKKGNISFVLDFFKNVVNDTHHLNNKALGWMLREVGKLDKIKLINFLKTNKVSNITFNYATEKLSKEEKSVINL